MSNIDLVLLGLIKQKSQSAYDIKKNIEYRNIPRWVKISEQSIYKKVLQLESKEYIVSHKEKEGNMPDKAIYTITNKGNDYFNKLMNDISNSDVSLYLDFNIIIISTTSPINTAVYRISLDLSTINLVFAMSILP